MVEGMEFFAAGKAAFHPAAKQIASGKEIREGPGDGGQRDKHSAAPKSIHRTRTEAQHRAGEKQHAGEGVEKNEPNPAGWAGLGDPLHGIAHPL